MKFVFIALILFSFCQFFFFFFFFTFFKYRFQACFFAWLSYRASLVAQRVKRLPAMQDTWVRSLGQKDLMEKEMATHSSTPAWKIPWTGELSGLLCCLTILFYLSFPSDSPSLSSICWGNILMKKPINFWP